MCCALPCLPPAPWHPQAVLSESPHRWWLLLEGELALLAEITPPDGRSIIWRHGPPLTLTTFCMDPLTQILLGDARVLLCAAPSAFYRPLKACLPTLSDAPATRGHVLQAYGIDDDTLNTIQTQYAAPPALLHRRLLDLSQALKHTLGLCSSGLVQLMHWQWRSPARRTATTWPTPLAAIVNGALAHVEATLYPHSADGGWA